MGGLQLAVTDFRHLRMSGWIESLKMGVQTPDEFEVGASEGSEGVLSESGGVSKVLCKNVSNLSGVLI